ncbi:hypothetical protein Ato02nite_062010 [Paractinoplanes toevensis]|uniref:Uncharacterized protein n=1 Tax=Paractinoplanes toevensis TaxID=571911 RepID=A0A919TFD0_9ACTN|nr:hypothetical protein Ato02nite_062010 [Actinoplanes toevensis]
MWAKCTVSLRNFDSSAITWADTVAPPPEPRKHVVPARQRDPSDLSSVYQTGTLITPTPTMSELTAHEKAHMRTVGGLFCQGGVANRPGVLVRSCMFYARGTITTLGGVPWPLDRPEINA